jgi:hypothetical protein
MVGTRRSVLASRSLSGPEAGRWVGRAQLSSSSPGASRPTSTPALLTQAMRQRASGLRDLALATASPRTRTRGSSRSRMAKRTSSSAKCVTFRLRATHERSETSHATSRKAAASLRRARSTAPPRRSRTTPSGGPAANPSVRQQKWPWFTAGPAIYAAASRARLALRAPMRRGPVGEAISNVVTLLTGGDCEPSGATTHRPNCVTRIPHR